MEVRILDLKSKESEYYTRPFLRVYSLEAKSSTKENNYKDNLFASTTVAKRKGI